MNKKNNEDVSNPEDQRLEEADETTEPDDQTGRKRDSDRVLAKFMDTKILAAIVGALATVIAGTIIYLGRPSLQSEIALEKGRQEIKDMSEEMKRVRASFDEATTSIQTMKDSISEVAGNRQITYAQAAEALGKSSRSLLDAYAKLCGDVCGRCSQECPFHQAKETGRQVFIYVDAQEKTSAISNETLKRLGGFRQTLARLQVSVEDLKPGKGTNER